MYMVREGGGKMPEIQKITRSVFFRQKPKRVAAYARVSIDTERTIHSLANQVDYFRTLIQSNPGWVYAGVYSDEGNSG